MCYLDNTVGFPILAAYALARRPPRPLKRLYERRGPLLARLADEYRQARADRDVRAETASGTQQT